MTSARDLYISTSQNHFSSDQFKTRSRSFKDQVCAGRLFGRVLPQVMQQHGHCRDEDGLARPEREGALDHVYKIYLIHEVEQAILIDD